MSHPGNDHWLAATCAARLHGQRALAAFGLLQSGIGWLVCLAAARWNLGAAATACCAAVCVCGLVERYLALRIALDAHLFNALARAAAAPADNLPALDQALAALQLAPAHKQGRPLAARAQGALRLLRWHGTLVGLQTVALAAAGALA